MIITSQCQVVKWYELFDEGYIYDAVMDRLTASNYRYELKRRSMREKLSLKISLENELVLAKRALAPREAEKRIEGTRKAKN